MIIILLLIRRHFVYKCVVIHLVNIKKYKMQNKKIIDSPLSLILSHVHVIK